MAAPAVLPSAIPDYLLPDRQSERRALDARLAERRRRAGTPTPQPAAPTRDKPAAGPEGFDASINPGSSEGFFAGPDTSSSRSGLTVAHAGNPSLVVHTAQDAVRSGDRLISGLFAAAADASAAVAELLPGLARDASGQKLVVYAEQLASLDPAQRTAYFGANRGAFRDVALDATIVTHVLALQALSAALDLDGEAGCVAASLADCVAVASSHRAKKIADPARAQHTDWMVGEACVLGRDTGVRALDGGPNAPPGHPVRVDAPLHAGEYDARAPPPYNSAILSRAFHALVLASGEAAYARPLQVLAAPLGRVRRDCTLDAYAREVVRLAPDDLRDKAVQAMVSVGLVAVTRAFRYTFQLDGATATQDASFTAETLEQVEALAHARYVALSHDPWRVGAYPPDAQGRRPVVSYGRA
jgi:hypothetical protein